MFQARLFDEPQLASLCLENIDKNTVDALAAEGFTDIDLGKVNYAACLSLSLTHNKERGIGDCLQTKDTF